MNNEQREQQMMNAADRYADEVCDESCTGAQVAETINDFCAGWRAADSHPHWISIEERLPEINRVADTWDCSDDVYVYLATRSCCVGRYEHDKSINEFYWVLYGVDKDIPVTHWMEIVPPRKEE